MLVKQMGYWANGEEVRKGNGARKKQTTNQSESCRHQSSITGTHMPTEERSDGIAEIWVATPEFFFLQHPPHPADRLAALVGWPAGPKRPRSFRGV